MANFMCLTRAIAGPVEPGLPMAVEINERACVIHVRPVKI